MALVTPGIVLDRYLICLSHTHSVQAFFSLFAYFFITDFGGHSLSLLPRQIVIISANVLVHIMHLTNWSSYTVTHNHSILHRYTQTTHKLTQQLWCAMLLLMCCFTSFLSPSPLHFPFQFAFLSTAAPLSLEHLKSAVTLLVLPSASAQYRATPNQSVCHVPDDHLNSSSCDCLIPPPSIGVAMVHTAGHKDEHQPT